MQSDWTVYRGDVLDEYLAVCADLVPLTKRDVVKLLREEIQAEFTTELLRMVDNDALLATINAWIDTYQRVSSDFMLPLELRCTYDRPTTTQATLAVCEQENRYRFAPNNVWSWITVYRSFDSQYLIIRESESLVRRALLGIK